MSSRATDLASSAPRSFSISARPRSRQAAPPRRGPDRPVVREDPILIYLHLRKQVSKFRRVQPVRSGLPAIQQTGLCEEKRSCTNGGDTTMPLWRFPQEGDHARRRWFGESRRTHDKGVERHSRERLAIQHHAGRGFDLPAFLRKEMEFVGRTAGDGIGDLEYINDGQNHHRKAGIYNEPDATHGPCFLDVVLRRSAPRPWRPPSRALWPSLTSRLLS